jgi:hypothetical protein
MIVTFGRSCASIEDKQIVNLIMKFLPAVLLFSMTLLPSVGAAKMLYAGGSLPLDQHKVRASLGHDELVFMQHNRRIAIPVKSITEISVGTSPREHYIGVSTASAQVLLKLSGSQYREFLAALERSTGIKATNTTLVPTVVRYGI